jgi:hypothetical protein
MLCTGPALRHSLAMARRGRTGGRKRAAGKQPPGSGALGLALGLVLLISVGKCAGGEAPAPHVDKQGLSASAAAELGAGERGAAEPDVEKRAAQPVASNETRYVSAQRLNCRQSASPSAAIVSSFGFAEAVNVRQESAGWAGLSANDGICWVSAEHLSASVPEPPMSRAPLALVAEPSSAFQCGSKRVCRQMDSCEEANFYLDQCGLSRLDGDSDGIPCESIC